MSPSAIVQKLWNYCNVLPACRAVLGVYLCLAGRQACGRDDLSTCDVQAGGMSYGPPIAVEPVSIYGASR
jgi:hypothetical protein